MTRRKRGRDKPRGRRRNRKKDLPQLNTQATWKIGQPRTEIQLEHRPESTPWEQRVKPFPESRALEDILGLYVMEVKHHLRGKKELEAEA